MPTQKQRIAELEQRLSDLQGAFADYVRSEGCGCCENVDEHTDAADRIGKLLGFNRYDDDSGWDFRAYSTRE